MIVGEPILMGGELGDEDERRITRLENNNNTDYMSPQHQAAHHTAQINHEIGIPPTVSNSAAAALMNGDADGNGMSCSAFVF